MEGVRGVRGGSSQGSQGKHCHSPPPHSAPPHAAHPHTTPCWLSPTNPMQQSYYIRHVDRNQGMLENVSRMLPILVTRFVVQGLFTGALRADDVMSLTKGDLPPTFYGMKMTKETDKKHQTGVTAPHYTSHPPLPPHTAPPTATSQHRQQCWHGEGGADRGGRCR